MKDCNKLKKRALIGLVLIILMVLLKPIDENFNLIDRFGLGLFIGVAFFCFIIGMYLLLPYIGCLEDSNKSHKPPFTK